MSSKKALKRLKRRRAGDAAGRPSSLGRYALEQMARNLVDAGRCSPQILDQSMRDRPARDFDPLRAAPRGR